MELCLVCCWIMPLTVLSLTAMHDDVVRRAIIMDVEQHGSYSQPSIDYAYEHKVLHDCFEGDSKQVRKDLEEINSHHVSNDFFKDAGMALDASVRCRPTDGCLLGAGVSGTLGSYMGMTIQQSCGYPLCLVLLSGCASGILPVGLVWSLNLFSPQQELKDELHSKDWHRRLSFQKIDQSPQSDQITPSQQRIQHEPPRQYTTLYVSNECQ